MANSSVSSRIPSPCRLLRRLRLCSALLSVCLGFCCCLVWLLYVSICLPSFFLPFFGVSPSSPSYRSISPQAQGIFFPLFGFSLLFVVVSGVCLRSSLAFFNFLSFFVLRSFFSLSLLYLGCWHVYVVLVVLYYSRLHCLLSLLLTALQGMCIVSPCRILV